ncbi:UNVERIFIED_CONTAM: hypothetical protein NCL1_35634 [Trichonephila clavipes]
MIFSQEQIVIVEFYLAIKSHCRVINAFQQKYSGETASNASMITLLVQRLRDTGSVADRKRSGRVYLKNVTFRNHPHAFDGLKSNILHANSDINFHARRKVSINLLLGFFLKMEFYNEKKVTTEYRADIDNRDDVKSHSNACLETISQRGNDDTKNKKDRSRIRGGNVHYHSYHKKLKKKVKEMTIIIKLGAQN